jgi:preprotein translocase subunit SecA
MGAIADAIAAYAEPLLKDSSGTPEGIQFAFAMAQLCWNLAVAPEEEWDEILNFMKKELKLEDAEFEECKRDIFFPMVKRHKEMFPNLHDKNSGHDVRNFLSDERFMSNQKQRVGRNSPCPCRSGKKFKQCCGKP